jgi:hypothetical protein
LRNGAASPCSGRRARFASASLALVLLVAGCGGSDSGPRDPEVEAITRVLASQAAAIADGDGQEACSHFSERGRRRFEAEVRARPELRVRGCERGVEEIAKRLPGAAIDALNAPVISEVRVRAPRASAMVEPPADLKELALAAGFRDVQFEVPLVKLSGRWKVDGVPVP